MSHPSASSASALTFWSARRLPPARRLLCGLDRVHHEPHAVRSPVLFVHGFPDASTMYAAYHTPAERTQPWLRGRSIYTLDFPNRQRRPAPLPSLADLRNGRLQREFNALVQAVIAASPTGKLAIVAHDWGATYTWALVRSRPDVPLEALISLSVGSSFRYDLAEHGPRALAWLYNIIFGMPYYLPTAQVRKVLDQAMQQAGYASPTRHETYRDSYHYWDWPQRLALLGPRLFGWGMQPAFTDIRFPVLFLRSAMDRIATTAGFEAHLHERVDCHVRVFEDVNHWFPEQHPERVLTEIRRFAALQAER